jgi:exonuclease VII small subunit
MEGYIKIESSKKHETMSIVQRYEQEMAELTTTVSSLNNQLAEMKTLHQE